MVCRIVLRARAVLIDRDGASSVQYCTVRVYSVSQSVISRSRPALTPPPARSPAPPLPVKHKYRVLAPWGYSIVASEVNLSQRTGCSLPLSGLDTQRAQAHNHTQNSNPRTLHPRQTSRSHAHTHLPIGERCQSTDDTAPHRSHTPSDAKTPGGAGTQTRQIGISYTNLKNQPQNPTHRLTRQTTRHDANPGTHASSQAVSGKKTPGGAGSAARGRERHCRYAGPGSWVGVEFFICCESQRSAAAPCEDDQWARSLPLRLLSQAHRTRCPWVSPSASCPWANPS